MPDSKAAQNDLYNGLTELLGSERAETLMAYLPHYDPNDVARRSDVDRVETRLDRLETRIDRLEDSTKAEIGQLRMEMTAALATVNARLGRLNLSLITGPIVMVATVLGTALVS